ncbi:MAG: tyrosinase family protein [Tahibacter sp.]
MRRSFALAVLALCIPFHAFAQTGERLSFQAFAQDPARVASLRRGIAVMQGRNTAAHDSADYRRSWEFWSAMHDFIPDGLPASHPLRTGFFSGEAFFVPPATPGGIGEVLGRCEHGTLGFLPWHRWYLYYFERVLQEAAQDAGLRVPYWDYSDPLQGSLPEPLRNSAYRTATGVVANPLFAERRTLGMNDGFIQPAVAALGLKSTFLQSDFVTFSGSLEGNAHGLVHCAVGQGCRGPLMGATQTAAKDPVFWLHHANIDRLWQCWLGQNAMPKTGEDAQWDAVVQTKYAFVDADGSIVHVDAADASTPHVKYENEACPELPAKSPLPRARRSVLWSGQSAQNSIRLGAQVVEIERSFSGARTSLNGAPMFSTQSQKPTRIYLHVDGVRVEHSPGVVYEVRLKAADGDVEETIGALTFFGVSHHDSGSKRYTYDVTEAIHHITGGANPTSVKVRLVPTLGVTGMPADAVSMQFDESAKPSVGSIDFEIVR